MPSSSKRTRGKERKANSRADANANAVANGYTVSGGKAPEGYIRMSNTALSKKLTEMKNNPKLSKRVDSTDCEKFEALADSLEANLKVSGGKPPEGYEYRLPKTTCTHGEIYPDVPTGGMPAGGMHVTDAAMKYFGALYMSHPIDKHPASVGQTAVVKVTDTFPAIAYHPYCRSVMVSALARSAADNLVGIERDNTYNFIVAKWCAEAIAMLDTFEGIEGIGPNEGLDKFFVSKDMSKNDKRLRNALGDGERRGIIRYIKKRIPCKCLDEMHESHTCEDTKKGLCASCYELFDYVDLKRCTGCGTSHYCGRECQLNDWPEHKVFCKFKSRERKN